MASKSRKVRTSTGPVPDAVARTGGPVGGRAAKVPVAGRRLVLAGVLIGVLGTSVAMLPAIQNPFGPAKAVALSVGAALVLLGLFLDPDALFRTVAELSSSKVAAAVGAFCVVAALATLMALDRTQALFGGFPDYRGLATILACGVLGLGALTVWRSERGPLVLGRAIVAAVGLTVVYSLLQRSGVLAAEWRGAFRVGSLLGNPSNYGVFLVALSPMVAWVALRDRSRLLRAAALAVLAGALASLFWTLSRGAWVAAVCGVVAAGCLMLVGRIRISDRRRALAVAVVVVAVIAIGAVLTPGFSKRAASVADLGSKTVEWRLNAWDSTVAMVGSRPFLGFGPDNYRYAYRVFQQPGQIAGRYGYQTVEAAHNLELDTAAAFGLPGLAALLALAWFLWAVTFRTLRAGGDTALPIALATGIVAAVAALQFHYVTMDTGAVLALLVAGAAALELGSAEKPVAAPRGTLPLRWAGLAGALAFAFLASAVVAVTVADQMTVEAKAALVSGEAWAGAPARLASAARRTAPWEPQIGRDVGSLAAVRLAQRFESAAYGDGIAAMGGVVAARPFDATAAAQRADVMLVAGTSSKDPMLVQAAAEAFAAVQLMDPNTGMAYVGEGEALLRLGRPKEAMALLKRGLRLSPKYARGWVSFALALRAAGHPIRAGHAEARASALR